MLCSARGNRAAECGAAVRAALYPPRGTRGVGPRRAARLTDRDTYFRRANDDTFVGVMIESQPGVDNIDDILAVPGLGGVIIGTEDLAASLGHLNDAGHDDVIKAIEQVSRRCAAAGVPFGRYAPRPVRLSSSSRPVRGSSRSGRTCSSSSRACAASPTGCFRYDIGTAAR